MFRSDPERAWGFYGHTLQLYRSKTPHAGFGLVRRWAERASLGYFVYTSNVDGHFQRAGFGEQRIFECHGSIHYLQCAQGCGSGIWPADEVLLEIDPETFRAKPPLPTCPKCGRIARPNVFMFNDTECEANRSAEQHRRYHAWLRQVSSKNLVAVEFGAGIGMPSVRLECIFQASTFIRVNPHDPEVPGGGISLPLGALEAITKLDAILKERR